MSNNKKTKTGMLYSIRVKFLAIILIFVAGLMLGVMGLINKTVGEVVLDQGIEKGLAVARSAATSSGDPLLTDDDLGLFTVIKGIAEDKGIVYSMVVGRDKTIKAHSDMERSGKGYFEIPEDKVFKEGKDHKVKFYNDAKFGYVYDIEVPVTSARIKEGIGYVHTGISRQAIDAAVDRVGVYIKYLTLAGLAIGGVGALLITGIIVKPVQKLIVSAKELGQGNFDHRIDVDRKDELGTLMGAFNEMAEGLKQKQTISESFGRYVAPEVLNMILTNKETWFKGKKIRVTVLFADIRGFTSYSEKTTPDALIEHLNAYFSLMTEIIQRHKGYIDKFIGDAIMVVFGSPVAFDDHAVCAARAACEMQEKLKIFNLQKSDADKIGIGIGLNTGEVVAGNLGSSTKMEYAVIGDAVNTASRLCSAAKKGTVIISKSVHAEIKQSDFEFVKLDPVTVKGKAEPLEIYSLIPRRGPDRKDDDTAVNR
ncbi:MAG: HAMP domain-containing protein [Deltaproteobacteria bacterium]|nr:HAMP domain-containing protein [Deltaproteobacteria bacterium]